MNIIIGLVIICGILIAFSAWCCIRIGAQSDKDIEKLELERPDLIQIEVLKK